MTNKFRSKAFIKIKHSILSATNSDHLVSCRTMIENSTPILDAGEILILQEYLLSAWDKINPVHETFANEMETYRMKQINNNQI